ETHLMTFVRGQVNRWSPWARGGWHGPANRPADSQREEEAAGEAPDWGRRPPPVAKHPSECEGNADRQRQRDPGVAGDRGGADAEGGLPVESGRPPSGGESPAVLPGEAPGQVHQATSRPGAGGGGPGTGRGGQKGVVGEALTRPQNGVPIGADPR